LFFQTFNFLELGVNATVLVEFFLEGVYFPGEFVDGLGTDIVF
jgi:hypothetical protein